LRQLSARLLQLQDEERRRIARELHDSTGQLLAVLVMNLAALNARASKFDAATAELVRKAMASARQASDEIRTLSYLLHPPTLDLTGLSSALQWFVEGRVAAKQHTGGSADRTRPGTAPAESGDDDLPASCRKASQMFSAIPAVHGDRSCSQGG